jgi:hypothetical protein
MMNDTHGGQALQLLLGLLFVALILAGERRASITSESTFNDEMANELLARVSSDYREKFRDQKQSKAQFDVGSIEKWKRSVVSIGRHEPRVGEFSWYPRRTGFAVYAPSRLESGTLIVSAFLRSSPQVAEMRVHAHPFLWPPAPHAHPAFLSSTGSLSFVRAMSAMIPPVRLADWTSPSYDNRFPVLLIGFQNGELVRFFSHSVGKSESNGRVRLASRPPIGTGELIGAPVFNTQGLVVGVYSPLDHRPTYVPSTLLRARLAQR